MSNPLAIAATTNTLRNLLLGRMPQLDDALGDLQVTTQPPDAARKGVTAAQLNLFLFQPLMNAAWRNMDMPREVRPGETGAPPLPLNLHYLITAYGRGDSDTDAVSHRVLGGAMSILHDHVVLGRKEIKDALQNNDLGEQFERLRITPLALSGDEMWKLWATFQTPYRVSMAYEVTVVLIDSRHPVRAALPVLRRGEADRGVIAVAGGAPHLKEIRYPRAQQAARLGEEIVITGESLVTDAMLRFASARLKQELELAVTAGDKPDEIRVKLPSEAADLARWAPGFYTVALIAKKESVLIASNEIAFALAPKISIAAAAFTPHVPQSVPPLWDAQITIDCEPNIAQDQRVLMILGNRQAKPSKIIPPAAAGQPTKVTFVMADVEGGKHLVRLRVDGVDSIAVVLDGKPPVPSFDPAQQVTVA